MSKNSTPGSALPDPVRRALRENVVDVGAVDRAWANISERRHALRGRPRFARVLGLAACGMLVAFGLLYLGSQLGSHDRALSSHEMPLEVVGENSLMETFAKTHPTETTVTLTDGSRITRGPDAQMLPIKNDGADLSFFFEKGWATFDVRPGGHRRWSIDCGPAQVEVLGTAFRIVKEPDRLTVTVERGSVLVRSEFLPERARRLQANEEVTIRRAGSGASSPQSENEPDQALQEQATRSGQRTKTMRADLIRQPHGGTNDRASIESLFESADRARAAGSFGQAKTILREIVSHYPETSEGGLAWFTIGRIEQEDLGRPAPAAKAFRAALAAGLPQALEEDVWARLVTAYAASGDDAAAENAAQTYLKRFPRGQRSAEVSRAIRR